MLQGDFYEVTDSLIIMGVPLLVIGAAIGGLIGAPGRKAVKEVPVEATTRRSTPAVVVGATAALVASLLALWLFLWGVGAISTPPLGIT